MSLSATSTATRTQVFNDPPAAAAARLTPAKCAFLIGINVLLVVGCIAVAVREIVLMDESSAETDAAPLLPRKEPSATELAELKEQQSRTLAVLPGDHHSFAPKAGKPLEVDRFELSGGKKEGRPDCEQEETKNTKVAKALWVFLAGALLNSEKARSIIAGGAL